MNAAIPDEACTLGAALPLLDVVGRRRTRRAFQPLQLPPRIPHSAFLHIFRSHQRPDRVNTVGLARPKATCTAIYEGAARPSCTVDQAEDSPGVTCRGRLLACATFTLATDCVDGFSIALRDEEIASWDTLGRTGSTGSCPMTIATIDDLVAKQLDADPVRDLDLKLAFLLRFFAALAVETLREEEAARKRLSPRWSLLALPTGSAMIEFLSAFTDDLVESAQPDEGLSRRLLDSLLIGSYRSPASRRLTGQAGGSGGAVSFLDLAKRLRRLLRESRLSSKAELRQLLLQTSKEVLAEMQSHLADLLSMSLQIATKSSPSGRRHRLTLTTPDATETTSRTAFVIWPVSPTTGELLCIHPSDDVPHRLSPLLAYGKGTFWFLAATPLHPEPRYLPLSRGQGDLPPPSAEGLAKLLLPESVPQDRLALLRQKAATRAKASASGPSGALRTGALLAGRFRLETELSRGTSSAIFEAIDLEGDSTAIVKILLGKHKPSSVVKQGFLREADVLRMVRGQAVSPPSAAGKENRDSQGVPELLYDGSEKSLPFLAIRPFSAATLRDLLKAPFPMERSVTLARRIASALDILHRVKVVHRDLKPENVLVDDGDRVMIVDFGLSRLRAASGLIPDDIGGTLPYMAPEAIRGESISSATDIFALGCILYELLTGEHLFGDGSDTEMADRILSGKRSGATLIDHPHREALYDLVHAATRRDPALRIRDCDLFLAFLDKASQGIRPTPSRRTATRLAGILGRFRRPGR